VGEPTDVRTQNAALSTIHTFSPNTLYDLRLMLEADHALEISGESLRQEFQATSRFSRVSRAR
jgi:hypothetical protein